ncbi:unnamed protein product [Schistosoma curassoni]|uniref:Peptidase M13 N-terminal domain-containing protein n=1 Tax=Schistosoma curassoni TaxID=6186 RepID=A0A183KVQ3_9TREM|nr:unnamed protein product [Schistosoma curassoni]VDP68163.1 unnamed protein product [Schistosoma curassoni]
MNFNTPLSLLSSIKESIHEMNWIRKDKTTQFFKHTSWKVSNLSQLNIITKEPTNNELYDNNNNNNNTLTTILNHELIC